MELCSNGSLYDFLCKKEFTDYDEWLIFMRQIISGVHFIHMQNVIHRDLKPCNILLNEQNVVKICDFGLAIDANAAQDKLKTFCGTAPYMPPEMINHLGSGMKSDVWTVAVIGYYLYKGERPFDSGSYDRKRVTRIYRRILKAEFHLKPDRDDPGFQRFVQLGLQRDMERRPTAVELLQLPLFARPLSVHRAKMPRKNQEVKVIPTYVLSPNKIYVQILDGKSRDFENMQFGSLQEIELQQLNNSGKNLLVTSLTYTNIEHIFF